MNMKIRNLLIFGFVLASAIPCAMAGNEGGHGGDPYALEFVTLGKTIAQALVGYQTTNVQLFLKWDFTPDQFSQVVSSTRIVSDEGDRVILKGQEVDAINFPDQNEILVNRTRWREDDLHSRVELVLHEYFGILGVERDRFDASIDFGAFSLSTTRQIDARIPSDAFMANLFYGRCVSIPALTDVATCDTTSETLAQAITCAQTQAESHCQLAGHSSCGLVSTAYTAKISTNPIGLRYCEVLTIMQ